MYIFSVAFLKTRVDYNHGFSSVFFRDTHEVTKIVLQNLLRQIVHFGPGNWTIRVVPFLA